MSALSLLTNFGAPPPGGGGGACDQYGVVSTSGGSDVNITGQAGWAFTLDAPKAMCGFRYYYRAGGHSVPTMRLWRVSDGALIATYTVSVPADADSWNEYDITPVSLSAGVEYMVTATKPTAGAMLCRWALSGYSLASGVNFTDSYRDAEGLGAMPTTVRPTETWFQLADFRFQS